MKLDIQTGHREFDRHCVDVSSCCALGAAQFSGGVRPSTQPEGQRYDLYSWFKDLPDSIRRRVVKIADARQDTVMLHEFHHHRGQRKIVHGYVVARNNVILAKFYTGPTHKSEGVIDVCAEYLGDPDPKMEVAFIR
jgi:hypothetical protein